jgi:4-aminobutyrate aminotransferase-like enzyme
MSLRLKSAEATIEAAHKCVTGGLITDWFLFAPDRLRIAPPLSISYEALDDIAAIVLQSI